MERGGWPSEFLPADLSIGERERHLETADSICYGAVGQLRPQAWTAGNHHAKTTTSAGVHSEDTITRWCFFFFWTDVYLLSMKPGRCSSYRLTRADGPLALHVLASWP